LVPSAPEQFGITEQAITLWKNQYPEFLASLNDGKTPFDANVAASMGQRALGYSYQAERVLALNGVAETVSWREHVPADVNAGFRWLYNRQPEKWRDRRNLNVEGALDVRLAAMTPDERAADAIALVARIQARLAAQRLIEGEASLGDEVSDAEEADEP
jgi:hypothetical protein